MEKLEWWGYPMVKKTEDIYNGLDTVPGVWQTDGHLATAYTRYAYMSRSKNHHQQTEINYTDQTDIFETK